MKRKIQDSGAASAKRAKDAKDAKDAKASPKAPAHTKESKLKATQRRKFIYDQVRIKGKLTLGELKTKYPGLAPQSLIDDLRILNALGGHLIKVGGEIIDASAPSTHKLSDRYLKNYKEKSLVADLGVSLLIGFPDGLPWDGIHAGRRIYTHEDILNGLSKCARDAHLTAQKVRSIFQHHLEEISRIVALDDGTTSLLVAEKLREFKVPVEGTNLAYLTVCTNSREIFNVLGDSEVEQIRAIIVGGQQIGRSSAIAGPLAEFFLRSAALLQFSISIVGTSGINVDKGLAFSDTQEEAIIKGVMFGKSVMRVIVTDNTKLAVQGERRGGYAFCSLQPQFCDLLITNSPIDAGFLEETGKEAKDAQKRRIEEFPKMIEKIESRGIPVLVATSDETAEFKRC